jgi:hypothetical protein
LKFKKKRLEKNPVFLEEKKSVFLVRTLRTRQCESDRREPVSQSWFELCVSGLNQMDFLESGRAAPAALCCWASSAALLLCSRAAALLLLFC